MSRGRQRLGLHARNEQGRLPPASSWGSWGSDDAICEADRPCAGTCERYVPPFEFTAAPGALDAHTYLAALAFLFDGTGTDDTTVPAPTTYVR